LDARGWQLARVWIVDWFRDPAAQTRRLAELVLAAKEKQRLALARTVLVTPATVEPSPKSRDEAEAVPTPPPLKTAELRPEPATHAGAASYVEADFAVPKQAIAEMPVEELASVVDRLLQVEAPIHRDEIARRLATLWGRSRAGSRIQSAINDALRWLSARGMTTNDGDFFELPNKAVVPRNRADASSTSLRKAEYLPPSEVRSALLLAIEHNVGIEEADALAEALRLLGFKSGGSQLRQLALGQLRALVRENAVVLRGERYYPS
jgi:hypothetical protein